MARAAAGDAREHVIRPRMSVIERFRRMIAYHELLVGMTRKELKVKYKNSVLGFAWSLLNPLLYLVVFYVAFVKILGSPIPAFPIYLLSGLLVWNLFGVGLGAACGAVVANSGLVKKVAFPREILPLAAVGSTLIQFFLQSMVLFTVLGLVRWHVAWSYVALVPLALLALLLITASLGILLSAINVYLRDTQHFLELALLAWFWVTPVVYGFMTIGKRNGLVHEGVHDEPDDADRADLPARHLRPGRQHEAAHGHPAALVARHIPRVFGVFVCVRVGLAGGGGVGVWSC